MNYRLSMLRSKGWFRLGLIGVAVMVPLTLLQHSLGLFSEGMRGFEQAAEYFASGAAIALIVGSTATWALRGFAVRAKENDDEEDGGHSSRPSSPSRPKG